MFLCVCGSIGSVLKEILANHANSNHLGNKTGAFDNKQSVGGADAAADAAVEEAWMPDDKVW